MNSQQLNTLSIPMLNYRLQRDLKRCEAKKKFFSTIQDQKILYRASGPWVKKELTTDKAMMKSLRRIKKLKHPKFTDQLRSEILIKYLDKRLTISEEILSMKVA